MVDIITLFSIVGILATVLAAIGLAAPRKFWIKVSALVTIALFLPTAYAALAELLSRPKPVRIEWAERNAPHATVLGAQLQEGKAIYLWLMLKGHDEPRAYVLPWNKRMARQLHETRREARRKGSKVMMRLPFKKPRDDGPRMFYAPPQPPLPPKQAARQDPLIR